MPPSLQSRLGPQPLLLECIMETPRSSRGFRVLNAWFSNPTILSTIEHFWNSTGTCGGMRGLSNELIEHKTILRKWNKEIFGDIFQNLKKAEEDAITAELSFDSNPTDSTREAWSQAMANLLLATKKETEFWKQKAHIRWMEKGDNHSKFFHTFVIGRRAKLTISQIKFRSGHTLMDAANIKVEAVYFFTQTFSQSSIVNPHDSLKFTPHLINAEDNELITRLPSMDEVKQAVWDLDPHSTCGPDGFNGEFFRKTWYILGKDLLLTAQEFFLGIPPPVAYGATVITLTPKSPNPHMFSDFRPISLSTFMRRCPRISHLAFADDFNLFTNRHFRNLLRIKGILDNYLAASGQAINYEKSKFYIPTRTPPASCMAMERALGMKPVQSLPLEVIKLLHKRMASFLWEAKGRKQKHHWISWDRV
ncbi:unnamed protein product [Cuscuta campestris]|uniref:Reverse transcriptase domain-containing protein n=1 Tax=Cuscuta campestris TaxID=132261 RepID=A0A484MI43_9ASTE|nr:unnamed protein product [Cuscuta campestris]